MSSAETSSGHRSQHPKVLGPNVSGPKLSGLGLVLCLTGVTLLAGCAGGSGFQPLHATSAVGGSGASEKFAALDIAPIPGRVGQRIRNELIFQATGGGAPLPPEYRLDIAIRESVSSTLVKIDGNASGQVYNLDASYKLVRISDKSVVGEGRSYGRAGFERVTSIFANVRARQNAEDRAAKTVGEELRTRILAHLSRPA
jgi:LPS-assembly lipoprotein